MSTANGGLLEDSTAGRREMGNRDHGTWGGVSKIHDINRKEQSQGATADLSTPFGAKAGQTALKTTAR